MFKYLKDMFPKSHSLKQTKYGCFSGLLLSYPRDPLLFCFPSGAPAVYENISKHIIYPMTHRHLNLQFLIRPTTSHTYDASERIKKKTFSEADRPIFMSYFMLIAHDQFMSNLVHSS